MQSIAKLSGRGGSNDTALMYRTSYAESPWGGSGKKFFFRAHGLSGDMALHSRKYSYMVIGADHVCHFDNPHGCIFEHIFNGLWNYFLKLPLASMLSSSDPGVDIQCIVGASWE